MLKLEKSALKNCPRLDFLDNILLQVVKVAPLCTVKFDRNTNYLYTDNKQTVLHFVLSAGWKNNIKKITSTMESLKLTSS